MLKGKYLKVIVKMVDKKLYKSFYFIKQRPLSEERGLSIDLRLGKVVKTTHWVSILKASTIHYIDGNGRQSFQSTRYDEKQWNRIFSNVSQSSFSRLFQLISIFSQLQTSSCRRSLNFISFFYFFAFLDVSHLHEWVSKKMKNVLTTCWI